jgi:diguanylate cyclase (GGDEF)-like protein/PAS domain S-box-containing protein
VCPRPADPTWVRDTPIDHHDVEYWTRQIRVGTWIAIGVTVLGCLRVLFDWPTDLRWWLVPLGLAIAVQFGTLFLPWARVVRNATARRVLILWWVAEMPLLYGFTAMDRASVVLYVPGAILIIVMASPLFSVRAVLALGCLGMLGYLGLVPDAPTVDATLVIGLATILAVVTGLAAATAANRDAQLARRRMAERRTEALLENASDAVLAIDRSGEVSYASPSARTVFGYNTQGMTGARLAGLVHHDDLPQVREWTSNLFEAPAEAVARTEARIRRADGTWLYADVLGSNLTADPAVRAAVLSVRDLGPRRALEEELTRQAFADSLTGLANRALFRDRVEHALARQRRGAGRVNLLLIDVDDFKVINDSLGHTAGDHLLCALAERLRTHVRGSDTLARIGGDEFAILVEDLDDLETAGLAERVTTAVRQPVRLGNRDVTCTVSVGLASVKAGDAEHSADELLRDADLAMYAAKNGGRDRFAVYDPAMYADVLHEARQRADLERALAEGEFVLHYQPIVDLPGRRLTGFEALVRWRHPRDGLVAPNAFIPVAEATGLIVPLGRWVLREACTQLARWRAEWPAFRHLRMSVNLSARQFQYDGLVADVAEILDATGVDPGDVVLEITESMLMRDTDATVASLRALKRLGVALAIDDFGTGYSSLSYLKQFPVDIIKIDRSFVDGVTGDSGDAPLAEAVVQLGRALQLQTVAEGIETPDQWSALYSLGCEFGQGYLFARPVEPGAIEQFLARPGEALPP